MRAPPVRWSRRKGAIIARLGDSLAAFWDGHTFTFGQSPGGCSCHETHVAPSQSYRVDVRVYQSADDAAADFNGFAASTEFVLPSAAIIDVPLYPPEK